MFKIIYVCISINDDIYAVTIKVILYRHMIWLDILGYQPARKSIKYAMILQTRDPVLKIKE